MSDAEKIRTISGLIVNNVKKLGEDYYQLDAKFIIQAKKIINQLGTGSPLSLVEDYVFHNRKAFRIFGIDCIRKLMYNNKVIRLEVSA